MAGVEVLPTCILVAFAIYSQMILAAAVIGLALAVIAEILELKAMVLYTSALMI